MSIVSKEKKLEYNRKYRQKHREKVNEIARIWVRKNKERINKRNREIYSLNKERYINYSKKWIKNNKDKVKLWQKKNKDKIRIYQKKYRSKPQFKEKEKIRHYAYYNLKNKIIEERKKCERCGSKENLELHHKKYTNNQKDIKLLCRKCHQNLHGKGQNGRNKI